MSRKSGFSERGFNEDNWGYPPYNRRSFQEVQQLFTTARLSRGSCFPKLFPKSVISLSKEKYTGLGGEPRTVAQMLDETYTDAFLVTKDSELICEEYRNGMTAHSHHLLNSVSKSFLGMLVGVLVSEGVLDPAENLVTYIPEFVGTAFEKTTLRQALDMTAAVKYGENYADQQAEFWRETAVVGWRPKLVDDQLPKTLFEYACSLRETEQLDGEKFHYRTVLTNVIAMALERATHQSVSKLLEQKIWQPLGPEQDAVVVSDSIGFPYFGAGMNACARDLARFGEMLAANGYYNERQIVPKKWVEDTLNGNEDGKTLFAASAYSGMIPDGHYRNQVWADSNRGLLICIGIHGQTIYVNKNTGVVVVKLSTHPKSADARLFDDTFLAMWAVTNCV
jgi:CubicO group peptidase (beta-lactamase class C family)